MRQAVVDLEESMIRQVANAGMGRSDVLKFWFGESDEVTPAVFIAKAKADGKSIAALGASTKGNVLLQYCDITPADVVAVGEVNPDKFGSFTPGSLIPIIDEAQLLAMQPDYLLVLPWHFRPFFEKRFGQLKSKLVFPLPELEIAGQ